MAEEGGEKTEEPTPHRLREAREKGQVAKSKEITTAILLLLTYIVLRYTGEMSWKELSSMAQSLFSQVNSSANDFSLSFVAGMMLVGIKAFAYACLPVFAISFFASVISEALQTGFVFASEPLSPKLERINPIEGFKRMFSIQGLVETIKSILKIVIVFYIAWIAVKDDLPYIIVLLDSHSWDAMALGASLAFTIAIRVGIFYIIIAILDYLYKRWEYIRGLRMSRQEVKEEYKRLEGDPQVKQRMRDLQRQVAYQRMMAAVPKADVVVTNPTHIAVALKYEQKKMKAPRVLAKGERKNAEKIKQIAGQYEVPIVENEPLARSIYRTTKIGQEIPRELYKAVAEVLAHIFKIKRDKEKAKKSRMPEQKAGLAPAKAG